ncbi:MAG: MBL fold metallo-hydrolase [Halioglobus sp.]
MKRPLVLLACGLLMAACQNLSAGSAGSSSAAPGQSAKVSSFITLGTAAGPSGEATRSQPANALLIGDDLYLVDAGDGAAAQLTKAGFRVTNVKGLFISHLHFDHTGGVLAVLGLRMQMNASETLTIYGPPGTQHFITGLLSAMDPAREAAYGMPGQSWKANVEVKELIHDSVVEVQGATIKVAENSHFKIPESSAVSEKAKSLSFRFDLKDRSIVYTGDTGPSKAVETLAQNADLLISEMMDIPAVLKNIQKANPGMPQVALDRIEWHFRAHHLTPVQVGELAAKAGVERVVVTHMSPNIKTQVVADGYRSEIARAFDGDITIANDLDRF